MNLNCLTESLIRVAPEPLGRKFEPGDGFAARQDGDWIPWEQTSVRTRPDAGFGDLSFLSRMTGELFLQSAIAAWPPAVKKRAKHWIGVFKRIRHLLVRDYYRLLPQPQSEEDWDAAQFCDGSGQGVIFVFRVTGSRHWQIVFPRALDPDMTYRFTNEADGAKKVIPAGCLMDEGLRVELEPDSAKLCSYPPESDGA